MDVGAWKTRRRLRFRRRLSVVWTIEAIDEPVYALVTLLLARPSFAPFSEELEIARGQMRRLVRGPRTTSVEANQIHLNEP